MKPSTAKTTMTTIAMRIYINTLSAHRSGLGVTVGDAAAADDLSVTVCSSVFIFILRNTSAKTPDSLDYDNYYNI